MVKMTPFLCHTWVYVYSSQSYHKIYINFVHIQTSVVSGMDGVECREEEEQMDSHCSGGIRACSRLRIIASTSHSLPCKLSHALGKMKKRISSLVPRPSITANAVEGLVKLLRRMTLGRCWEAWHFRWTAVLVYAQRNKPRLPTFTWCHST